MKIRTYVDPEYVNPAPAFTALFDRMREAGVDHVEIRSLVSEFEEEIINREQQLAGGWRP